MKYSIIVPVYNAEKYLDACLRSVLIEKRSDIEVIAVDDGSKDTSLAILREWEKRDSRLKIVSQKNSGVSVARNNGIKNASGKWILFLDSDDYFLKSPFEKFDYLTDSHQDCEFFIYNTNYEKEVYIDSDREEFILAILGTKVMGNKYSDFMCLATVWGKLYNSKMLKNENLYFDPELVMGEDMFFNMQVSLLIKKIVTFTNNFYYYRPNENSASKGYNPNVPKRDLIFQKKLIEFCKEHGFQIVKRIGCKATAINGILLSCNSCFFKYPLLKYKESKYLFKQFIQNEVYQHALNAFEQYENYNILQKFTLWSLKKRLYFPGYILRKICTCFREG